MDFWIAFIATLAIALFFVVRFKLNAAVAPFFTVAVITLWLCFICMVDLLYVGVWLVVAFALFSLVYVFVLKKVSLKETVAQFFTPGMVFFIVVSVLFYILLLDKQPAFRFWDEFSFWGIAAKTVHLNNRIYTLFHGSMINFSYPPALPLWSYFIQFFGAEFTDWKVYLAYDILMMSVMAMLFARVKWKNIGGIVALSGVGVYSLYMFWYAFEGKVLYCDSYADIPIGLVFAGVLLAHFYAEKGGLSKWFVTLTGLMLLTFIKDIGFALGLVAAVIIAFDMLVSGNYPTQKVLKSEKKWLRLIYPALLFAAVIFSYAIWAIHFNAVTDLHRTPDPYQYSALEIFTGKDPYFLLVMEKMWAMLFVDQVATFGTIFLSCMVFTLIPILVGLFTKDKKRIVRLTAFSVFMLCGFALYYVFHAYMYTAIYPLRDLELPSLIRYVSTYLVGWFIALVGVCGYDIAAPFFKKFNFTVGAAVAFIAVFATWYYSPVHPDQYVFTSWKVDTAMSGVRELMQYATRKFYDSFTADDRIYFVCQETDGGEWQVFNHEMVPAYTVLDIDGGNFVKPGTPNLDEIPYAAEVDRARFVQYLRDNDVDFVFVFKMNDYFFEEFAPLFSDSLMGVYDRTTFLYLVVDDGQNLQLVEVIHAEHLALLREQYPQTG